MSVCALWKGSAGGYALRQQATHPTDSLPRAIAQVKYKNVMKQYNLGPNGGILTSCNLFATRFDQVGCTRALDLGAGGLA